MKRMAFLTMALVLALSTTVLAQGPGPGAGCGGGPGQHDGPGFKIKFLKHLGLTDEQIQQVTKMHLEHQKKVIPLRSGIRSARDEMRVAMTGDKADQGAINKAIDTITQNQKALMQERTRFQRSIRALLPDDKKAMWDAHILNGQQGKGKMRGAHHGMRGRRHRGPGTRCMGPPPPPEGGEE